MSQQFWQTLALGSLAGMRSMSAPAALSHGLQKNRSAALGSSLLRFMQTPTAATTLKVAAGAEMIGDKLPGMPDRTAPAILGGRILSGALVGATAYKAKGANAAVGAALGGVMAVAATFGALFLRKSLDKATGFPDVVWGLAEDGLVLTSAQAIAKDVRGKKKKGTKAKKIKS
ncbi:DUF4126 family protein [Hymenobacter sp. BT491]|uniref:DUF4126 family protein n=1 Tax=Hymenobacter sp. BT491 TaxID=2766779 RepID=UPI0016536E79|nr:DUF4126 family protein [Hymenobacter sp. BT491]MBC6990339.1 DUF4126 family protein [Hymenobacter sp. BT491]